MFSLKGTAVVAVLLAGVQALVHGVELWLGTAGLYTGTLLGALADLHAALAAVFTASQPTAPAGLAVMLALAVHALSKSVTAGVAGGARYLAWFAPGLWAHTLLGVVLLWFLRP